MADKAAVGSTFKFGDITFGYLDPVTLTANPLNYQTHSDIQRQALTRSINEFGWVGFPIFNTKTRRLVDGHARVDVSRRRGEPGIVCVLVNLTEVKEKRLLASYDRIGRLAGSDDNLLARILQDCADDGMPAGWTEDQLGDILLRLNPSTEENAPTRRREMGSRPPAEEEEGDSQPVFDPNGSLVTVQLFFTPERAAQFRQMVDWFKADMGLPTVGDAVFELVRDAYEGVGGG
jgi:hypothetical protein